MGSLRVVVFSPLSNYHLRFQKRIKYFSIENPAHGCAGSRISHDVIGAAREYDTDQLQKTRDLDEQLSQAKKAGVIIHQTPYLVVRIVPS